MATHSSILAWRIPGMGEPGGLLSMGLQRVGHDWSDLAAAAAAAEYLSPPLHLLPLVAEFLSFIPSLDPAMHQARYSKCSFGFPRAVLKFKFVVFSWSADLDQFCVVLTSYLPKQALDATRSTHRADCRVAVCYGDIWSFVGTMDQLWGIHGKGAPMAHGKASWWSPWCL